MFVHTFIRGSSGHFPYTEILRKPFFNNNHFILVIKFEKLNLRKSGISKKKQNSQYSIAVNKFPRFLVRRALDDLQQASLSQVLEISRQYFLLTTNCAKKSRCVPLILKVPKFISRHAASQHVTYVIMSKARVFPSWNYKHTRFNFLECRNSPRAFKFKLSFRYFC